MPRSHDVALRRQRNLCPCAAAPYAERATSAIGEEPMSIVSTLAGAVFATIVMPMGFAHSAAALQDCASCPEMVGIPAGRFVMGASAREEERENLAQAFRHRSEPQRT